MDTVAVMTGCVSGRSSSYQTTTRVDFKLVRGVARQRLTLATLKRFQLCDVNLDVPGLRKVKSPC